MNQAGISLFFEQITSSEEERNALLHEFLCEYGDRPAFNPDAVLHKSIQYLARKTKILKEEIELLKKK